MKYAINYVLGRETHVIVVDAPARHGRDHRRHAGDHLVAGGTIKA